MTQPEYMKENGFLMITGVSDAYKARMEYFKEQNPLLIYSMWLGYVNKDSDAYDSGIGSLYHGWNPDRRVYLHTSGHATGSDIKQMILTVKPQKYIIPIHTENPEAFENLRIHDYVKMMVTCSDGQKIIL